jgi:hypothetical protein
LYFILQKGRRRKRASEREREIKNSYKEEIGGRHTLNSFSTKLWWRFDKVGNPALFI